MKRIISAHLLFILSFINTGLSQPEYGPIESLDHGLALAEKGSLIEFVKFLSPKEHQLFSRKSDAQKQTMLSDLEINFFPKLKNVRTNLNTKSIYLGKYNNQNLAIIEYIKPIDKRVALLMHKHDNRYVTMGFLHPHEFKVYIENRLTMENSISHEEAINTFMDLVSFDNTKFFGNTIPTLLSKQKALPETAKNEIETVLNDFIGSNEHKTEIMNYLRTLFTRNELVKINKSLSENPALLRLFKQQPIINLITVTDKIEHIK